MKSLLKKRLPGILAAGLVALAVGAASAPASASSDVNQGAVSASASGANTSALTTAQKKAKARELRACARKRPASKARACKAAVNRKYRRLANQPPPGRTYTVNLGDNFFAPSSVDLKVNDSINWSWATVGGFEPHNVTFDSGPSGVSRNDFLSQTTAIPSYRFKRTFKVPGSYRFVCSLHFEMTMTANVTR
jgi:plastocyanin